MVSFSRLMCKQPDVHYFPVTAVPRQIESSEDRQSHSDAEASLVFAVW